MKDLVLISHGYLCEELKKSVEMIMGQQPQIHALGLMSDSSPKDFQSAFEQLTASLDEIVVFADLMGGTPCNIAVRTLMEGKIDFDLYTGMNMPMVISYLNESLTGISTNMIIDARSGIVHVNDQLISNDNDE